MNDDDDEKLTTKERLFVWAAGFAVLAYAHGLAAALIPTSSLSVFLCAVAVILVCVAGILVIAGGVS